MEIIYHKNFDKAFVKLTPKQQVKVDETINIFRQNPHDSRLKNHALHGNNMGKRAISAGGDLRLVFEEEYIEEENYSPEDIAKLDRLQAEAEQGINMSPVYKTKKEALAHLDRLK